MLKVFYDLFPSTTKYIKRNVYNVICKQQEEKNTLSIQQVIKMKKRDTTVKLKRKDIKHLYKHFIPFTIRIHIKRIETFKEY